MSVESIRNALHRQPFEPFRVFISNSEHYDVRHPDAAMLLRSYLKVVQPGDNGEPTDREARLAL